MANELQVLSPSEPEPDWSRRSSIAARLVGGSVFSYALGEIQRNRCLIDRDELARSMRSKRTPGCRPELHGLAPRLPVRSAVERLGRARLGC
jgi:hypothetical protein